MFPIQIIGIITGFYYIPEPIAILLGLMGIIYIGFIIINTFTGEQN